MSPHPPHGNDDPAHDAFEAARSGDETRLSAALAAGMAVHSQNGSGDSLLMLAAYHGHDTLVGLLLDHGADPDTANARGQCALAGVCYKGYAEVARRLLEAGAAPDGVAGAARSPLMYAAMYNHAQVTRLLLAHGADRQLRNRDGKSALDLAREMRAVYTIALLEQDAQ